jgi:hypothetical protein
VSKYQVFSLRFGPVPSSWHICFTTHRNILATNTIGVVVLFDITLGSTVWRTSPLIAIRYNVAIVYACNQALILHSNSRVSVLDIATHAVKYEFKVATDAIV